MKKKQIMLSKSFPLPVRAVTESIAIMGRKGSGKTYTGGRLFEQMHGIGAQCVALDPVGNWYGLRLSASGKSRGLDIPVFGGEHGDMPITPEAGKIMAQVIVERRISCVIDLMLFRKGQRKRFVTDFAEELFSLKKRQRSPLHLFIEEARKFIPQKPYGPDENRMIGAFEDIVRLGRNYGLGASLLDQRPQSVNKEVLSQTELLIVHQLTGKHERKEIEAWVRDKATAGEDSLKQLDELQPGECFFWSPGLMRTFAKVKVGKKSTYDASSTPELGGEADDVAPRPLRSGDLTVLQESMAAIVEQAEKDDPKKLQSTLRQRDREISSLNDRVTSLQRQLESRPAEVERVEIPVLTEAQMAWVQQIMEPTASALEVLAEAMCKVSAARPARERPVPPTSAPTKTLHAPRVTTVAVDPSQRDELTGPEQRILDATAWLEGIGVDWPEINAVAFLAGYKPGGGAFNNPRGRLRAKGLVEYSKGGRMYLTDQGRAVAIGPEVPLTTDRLHSQVLGRLSGPETRILQPLLEVWPKGIGNDDLAEAAGYSPGGGAYNNPRGRLRTLGLIEYERGMVRAREFLFLKRS